MRGWFGFFAGLLLISFPAHAQNCSNRSCQDGVTFTVDPAHEWKSGIYDIRIATGTKMITCRGELPLKACNKGASFKCSNKRDVKIVEKGCGDPEAEHRIEEIEIAGTPSRVIVSIVHQNQTIVTNTVAPQYESVFPNGRKCGPVCRTASYDLFAPE